MILPAKFVRTALLTVAVSAVCVVGASAASVGAGTVNTDALRLREEANSSSTILATASKGDVVVILEEESDGWYKVDYKSVEGYMSADYLDVSTKADVTIGYGLVETDGSPLNMRSGPGTDYSKVTSLNDGAVVTIVGIDNGWYKVKTSGGSVGYVSSDYMVTCKDSAGSRGDGTVVAVSSSLGQQVVDYAAQFLGTPYVYGGNGPNSFDCSGFTSYVYRHFGYTLSELQPGDLVFFKSGGSKPVSHVGIYVGGGQFIHASTNTYEVRYDNLTSGYYNNVYVYARRVL